MSCFNKKADFINSPLSSAGWDHYYVSVLHSAGYFGTCSNGLCLLLETNWTAGYRCLPLSVVGMVSTSRCCLVFSVCLFVCFPSGFTIIIEIRALYASSCNEFVWCIYPSGLPRCWSTELVPAALAAGHATGDKPGTSEKTARENSMKGPNAITGVTGTECIKKN